MGGRGAECTLLKEQLDEHCSAARVPARRLHGGHGAVVTYSHTCAGRTFKGWISASFSFCQQILQDLLNLSALAGPKYWLAPPFVVFLKIFAYSIRAFQSSFSFFPEGNISVSLCPVCPEVSPFCLT